MWFQIATTLRSHDLRDPMHVYMRLLTAIKANCFIMDLDAQENQHLSVVKLHLTTF